MPDPIINIAVLAHVDAGKTTTVEQMLYLGGLIKSVGSVEEGNTRTDWLPIERARGISVQNALISMPYNGVRINIIDTPGHTDFTGEVERALIAVDCAVLILSAIEGVQTQTEIFWKALRLKRTPTILFVNKVDRAGCDCEKILNTVRKELTSSFIQMNAVIGEGERACCIRQKKFSEEDIFTLGEFDAKMAEAFLSGQQIGEAEIKKSLAAATASCDVFPLLFGAAALGLGVRTLMDAVTEYFPKIQLAPDGAVSGKIYKIVYDRTLGKAAHVRMFTGSVRNRDLLEFSRESGETFSQKVTQIKNIVGERYEDAGIVRGGEISAFYGLSDAKTGDWIGAPHNDKSTPMAAPLFSVQMASPDNKLYELYLAAKELADEDPGLDLYWNQEERELAVNIMGPIQIEVLTVLLKERYNLEAVFSPPTVIYKETPAKKGIGFEAYTMPKPCWAIVELEMEPLPRGSGLKFSSIVNSNQMFPRYQHHVEVSVARALKQGLRNWETIDLSVKLIGGEHHLMHTHPMDFFLATPIAVMNGLVDCGTILLEPLRKFTINADEEHLSGVIGDIINMKGEFDSPILVNGKFEMEAVVPVAASADYPITLTARTAGKARLRAQFYGYRECPAGFAVSAKRHGVNPLDRAKWILTMRNALANDSI